MVKKMNIEAKIVRFLVLMTLAVIAFLLFMVKLHVKGIFYGFI